MKRGDIIGIGHAETRLSVVCQITDITPEHVKFWVLNGAWTSYLKSNGVLEAGEEAGGHFRLVNTVEKCKIVFTGNVPRNTIGTLFGRPDYQAIFEYMNDYLDRPWIVRKWVDFKVGFLNNKFSTLRRLKFAMTAFNDAWQGRGHHTTEDTIPF